MTKIIRTTDYPGAAATRIRPLANADNTDSVIDFVRSVSFCLSVSIRSLPPRRVIRGPLLRPIRARVLSGSLNQMRVKSAPSVVQIFRQNEPNAQNQFCSHSVNSVRGSAPVSPHRLGRLGQSPLPEKPAGFGLYLRYCSCQPR